MPISFFLVGTYLIMVYHILRLGPWLCIDRSFRLVYLSLKGSITYLNIVVLLYSYLDTAMTWVPSYDSLIHCGTIHREDIDFHYGPKTSFSRIFVTHKLF